MSLEATAAKASAESVRVGIRTIDATIKKAWSILDAASEKKTPSEVLSKNAVRAIQGKIES